VRTPFCRTRARLGSLKPPRKPKGLAEPHRPTYRLLTARVLPRHLDLGLGFLYQLGFCTVEQKKNRGSLLLSIEIPPHSSTADLLKRISGLQTIFGREKIFRDAKIKTLHAGSWVRNHLKYLQPFVLRLHRGKESIPLFLTIDPRGGNIPASSKRQDILYLEPSLAFGTGTHASTQLAAELLGQALIDQKETEVLDVGCGTGILAMAAEKLGASEAWAVDNDPTALTIARRNFCRNRISGIILKNDLQAVKRRFGVIVANILLKTLVELKGDLIRRLKRNGLLIVSGLLYRDVPALLRAYGDFRLLKRKNKKGWSALLLKRK
jgi:ribosomal protein L11 methyltransferase